MGYSFRILLVVLNFVLGSTGQAQEMQPVDDATLPAESQVVRFRDVEPIFEKRCSGCHANASTGTVNWSDYNTVVAMKEQIYLRVVTLRNMPMYTKMPQEERHLIKLWIDQGALN